jgi:dTDP-4-amino-4,6-dideoxygalactose transaminase
MDPIMISRRHGLVVIEDAAQSHGADYEDGGRLYRGYQPAYPGKNLGAYGEGGAAVTNDPELARRMALLRDWGQESKYHHIMHGYNYRMDAIQGAVLNVKMDYIEQWTEARRSVAAHYDSLFANSGIQTPASPLHSRHVYHVYAIRTAERDRAQMALSTAGIGTGIHYTITVHLHGADADPGYRPNSLPVSEAVADQFLSLPIYAELRPNQVAAVVAELKACL